VSSPVENNLPGTFSALTLAGKTALVTGASQGLGRAIAIALAAQGARVALAARNAEKLAEVAETIASQGGEAVAYTLDVSSESSIKETAKAALAAHGTIDILINNAGITRDGLMMRMKRADWDDVLNTNLTGAFLLTQAFLPSMVKARWGRIVNITSVVAQTGQAGQVNYAASKAALIGFTRSLAREVASRTITVNAIAPGFIETAMTHVLTDVQKQAMLAVVPLGRAGTDEEIAHAAVFLSSPAAGYITGHTLDVNGGMFMQ
jgi:3-oxoacyl-[acyl-carrier protein] reductase